MPGLITKKEAAFDLKNNFSGDITVKKNSDAARSVTCSNEQMSPNDLIFFITQLSVMLDSGVVLSDSLDVIGEQAEEGSFKKIVSGIGESVKSGEKFSNALAAYPKVFDSMFVSMVRASEASGKMSEMLSVLCDYLNFEAETKKQVKSALTYPFIMAMMAVAASGTLMFFVLPRFMKIYEARGAALPKLTQILVSFGAFISDPKSLTISVTVLAVAGFALYSWLKTEAGIKATDFLKIRTPVLGTMFRDMITARSMRIMSTMIGTGVNIMDTLEVMQGASDNFYYKQLWGTAIRKISDGYQLSESLSSRSAKSLIYPAVVQMLKAGEKSGKIGNVSDKISIFYEKKLQASIKSAMVLIEPVMITILGGIIGTIAIALLLPVFKISSVIAH